MIARARGRYAQYDESHMMFRTVPRDSPTYKLLLLILALHMRGSPDLHVFRWLLAGPSCERLERSTSKPGFVAQIRTKYFLFHSLKLVTTVCARS